MADSDSGGKIYVSFMQVSNTVTHFLIGIVSFSAIFYANVMASGSFRTHIYLCVIGYTILMSLAILSLNPFTGWAKSFSFKEKKLIHLGMQTTGSVLALSGSIIRIMNVNNNFSSPHGILGLIAMILTFLSLIGGVLNYFSLLKVDSSVGKTVHSCIGSLTIIFAFVTLCLAFDRSYRTLMGSINADLSIAFTVFALVGVLLSATYKSINRMS